MEDPSDKFEPVGQWYNAIPADDESSTSAIELSDDRFEKPLQLCACRKA
jgi:hypothetical protein